MARPVAPCDVCSRVDALVGPISALGDDAMRALMCVIHHAYAVLEGGSEEDVAALREAVASLVDVLPEAARSLAGELSDMAARVRVEAQ